MPGIREEPFISENQTNYQLLRKFRSPAYSADSWFRFLRGFELLCLKSLPFCVSLFLFHFFRGFQIETSFLYLPEKAISLQPAFQVFECFFNIISTYGYLQITSFPFLFLLIPFPRQYRQSRSFWHRKCLYSLWVPEVLLQRQIEFVP